MRILCTKMAKILYKRSNSIVMETRYHSFVFFCLWQRLLGCTQCNHSTCNEVSTDFNYCLIVTNSFSRLKIFYCFFYSYSIYFNFILINQSTLPVKFQLLNLQFLRKSIWLPELNVRQNMNENSIKNSGSQTLTERTVEFVKININLKYATKNRENSKSLPFSAVFQYDSQMELCSSINKNQTNP